MKPTGDVLRKADWTVRPVSQDQALRLVQDLHYARGASNTRTFLHGLFREGESFWDEDVQGIAWWIPPTRSCAEANYAGDFRKVLVLSRMVIDPSVPMNAASFLLGKTEQIIRRDARFECLLTYADERQGHTGAIYRAANWEYLGLTNPEPIFETASGVMVSRKSGPKTRTRKQMEELGHRQVGVSRKHRFRKILI